MTCCPMRISKRLLSHQQLISSDMVSPISVSIFWTCLLFGISDANGFRGENASNTDSRQGRLFSLFNIVVFEQGGCNLVSDSTMKGTCMTTSECVSKGGSADGNCASGFGVCCSFVIKGCGGAVSHNCTYVQNTEFPATTTGGQTCKFGFNRICDNLCQIRLDFVNLAMTQPPSAGAMLHGDCATSGDFLLVDSPTGNDPPVTCGTLTGQHMFLETGSSGGAGSIDLTFGSATATRTFKIKVTYYQCDSLNKAPTDCLQYFTGVTGTFQSFNYQGGQLIDNQRYSTCFRQELGYCTIQYSEAPTTNSPAFDFFINGTPDIPATPRKAKGAAGGCVAFIQIPATTTTTSNHCGGLLSSKAEDEMAGAVFGEVTPFRVTTIVNDKIGAAPAPSVAGYSLQYTQVPC